jgi:hypothetical protein
VPQGVYVAVNKGKVQLERNARLPGGGKLDLSKNQVARADAKSNPVRLVQAEKFQQNDPYLASDDGEKKDRHQGIYSRLAENGVADGNEGSYQCAE